ncbi:DUF2306 domain-containing protein [Longispora sp. K20-0274]|uniref:DUF2306 domain-containing protein n=1 Tax=Longispora sp. K20-0274 TaxID=3088255 RepID=UPI00399A2977
MTQNTESPGTRVTPPVVSGPPRAWWRHPYPWLVTLAVLVVFNLIYALPRYLSMDPAQSRSILAPNSTIHWPLLVAHVVTGNVAMVTVFLQLWPWLRRNHPAVHRFIGRVYVFAGALPAALLGIFALVPLRSEQAGIPGLVAMGVLWTLTTLVAVRMARRRRYAEHRRWMVYSFALAMGTTWGRLLYLLIVGVPGFDMDHVTIYLEVANLGWVFNLLGAHAWMEWRAVRTSRAGNQVITYPSPIERADARD